jgi:glycosyltransferase involved in cell wall biosynthesis
MPHIAFYQNELCHHKSPFIRSLATRDDLCVSLVSDTEMQPYRTAMGLSRAHYGKTNIVIPTRKEEVCEFVDRTDSETIHVVEGMRGGFCSKHAMQRCLTGKRRTVIFTEPGDHRGLKGIARKLLYRYEAIKFGGRIDGILATGKLGVDWFVHCGYPRERVFPFCYAVDGPDDINTETARDTVFQIVYCGQLIPRKNIPLLFRALAELSHRQWQLSMIGDGPLRQTIAELAERLGLSDRITWHRVQSNSAARELIGRADLLVLPSHFDGWGAVVNEALVAGTPVVCSDACGASDLVLENWRGEVFRAEAVDELTTVLERRIAMGIVTYELRSQIAEWASRTISGGAVAEYFLKIMDHLYHGAAVPQAPWYERLPRNVRPLIAQRSVPQRRTHV